jgi:hypothetical protein
MIQIVLFITLNLRYLVVLRLVQRISTAELYQEIIHSRLLPAGLRYCHLYLLSKRVGLILPLVLLPLVLLHLVLLHLVALRNPTNQKRKLGHHSCPKNL